MTNRIEQLLLTDEERLEIRKQVPENERQDIQGLIRRYLEAQLRKVLDRKDVAVLDVDQSLPQEVRRQLGSNPANEAVTFLITHNWMKVERKDG